MDDVYVLLLMFEDVIDFWDEDLLYVVGFGSEEFSSNDLG